MVENAAFQFERFFDLVAANVRILAVFEETRALMLAENECYEGGRIEFFNESIRRSPRDFRRLSEMPVAENSVTASSVYLSKSVSKMPWYMK